MTSRMGEQMSLFDLAGPSTKMYRAHCPQTKARTSAASSKSLPKSSRKMPLFLDLTTEYGVTAERSWQMGGVSLGEYTMGSFGEQPNTLMNECIFGEHHNGVSVSLLSQILVDAAPQRYSLSAKACQGILNRASRRGKKLPEILQKALENQVMA